MEDLNVNQAKNKNITNIELPKMLMAIYHNWVNLGLDVKS